MKLFYLPNLRSGTCKNITLTPKDLPDVPSRPALADKSAYRRWCESPETEHVFFSLVEGLTPGARVSKANEPYRIHGLVGEYDARPGGGWREEVKRNAAIVPTWISETFSGNVRMIWAFESPVPCAVAQFSEQFFRAAWLGVKPKKLAPGWQEEESSDLSHYFEIGSNWEAAGGLVPAWATEGWQVTACGKVRWEKEGLGAPMDRLRVEGEKRWPGRWPGGWERFDVGARGVRFWAPEADAQGAIVTSAGMKCFTGDKPFVFWDEIFGAGEMRKMREEGAGKAIEGVYFCPATGKYWANSTVAGLQPWGKEDIKLRLVQKGASPVVQRGRFMSEVDELQLAIQNLHTIDGTFPAFFRPEAIVTANGQRFLNTSKAVLVQPAVPEGTRLKWGEGFPWIAEFLPKLFGSQVQYYLAWLAYYYQSCLAGRPQRGMALFIAGPKNCGKTALNNVIHKQIFGAAGEATRYLTGEDNFNGTLFGCPIWTVDDGVANTDSKSRTRFSQAVKAISANDEFTMRAMYREGLRMHWTGRLIVTMNDDPESLQMLPSTEGTLLDKIMLLRAYPTFHEFPADEEVAGELPAFCAFLRDMPRDPAIWTGGRFGVAAYHDPQLIQTTEDAQESTSAQEIILDWATQYFAAEENQKLTEWAGNPTELLKALCQDDKWAHIVTKLMPNAVWIGRNLNKLLGRGEKWVTKDGRRYTIKREGLPKG